MFQQLTRYLALIRFSHTVFALPFALLSAVLAWRVEPFRPLDLLGILLCMVFARAAAMSFNRLVDHSIDAENPRTRGRHLPSGELSPAAVKLFTVIASAGFIGSTALFLIRPDGQALNVWPLILAVPVLLFLLGYSYAKRFTALCHYWLSAALMLSPIAAWIAIRGNVEWPPVLLAGVIFTWVGGFDIIYACQDADFDRQRGLHSIPARFGIPTALRIALFSHVLTILFLVGLWFIASLGWLFLIGVVLVAGLLAYEHRLVRPDDLTRVNIAFFQVNAVISIGLLLIGVADILVTRMLQVS